MIPEISPSQSHSVVYLDTSYLLDRQSSDHILTQHFDFVDFDLRITDGVVDEVRAQAKDVRFNTYLDFLLNRTPIVSRSYFRRLRIITAFDVIRSLARQYHPYIARQLQTITNSPVGPQQKLKQMINEVRRVSHEGAIWKATYEHFTSEDSPFPDKTKKPRHRFYQTVLTNVPHLHKAWYKYHNKRIKQELAGDYRYTDEDLVAAAFTEALARRKRAIILTRDSDVDLISWQFENNLIMSSCIQDLTPSPQIGPTEFWAEFTTRCQALNASRRMQITKRREHALKSKIQKNHTDNPYTIPLLTTGRGDVLVFLYGHNFFSSNAYIYPEFITRYLRQAIKYYEKRNLGQIWIPLMTPT